MKNLFCLSVFVFCSLFFASIVAAQCQGNVYITSLSWQTANSVHGFTSTELDYCAGIYYDPANLGNFTEGYNTGFALIGESYTQGYADSVPASLNFDFFAPVHNGTYSTNGNHYVIAYYQVYVPIWNNYYWYDPWNLGFGEFGGGNEVYYGPDYYGYWSYVSYWVSNTQFVGSTVDIITYTGQTQCLPGQQFTQTGQPCSSIPECQPGQQFMTTGETCPNYVPPPEPPAPIGVTVEVLDQPLYPSGIPGKSKNTYAVACITGVSASAGRSVALQLINDSVNSGADGGHAESQHTGPRPLGNLGRTTGVTGADGCFKTTYKPSAISSKLILKATISGITSETDIWVFVPGLSKLPANESYNYRLFGGGPEDCNAPFPDCTNDAKFSIYAKPHPSDHWVVTESIPGLIKIADDYKARFYGNSITPDKMIHYNDASLIGGGKFDLPRTRMGKTKPDWLDGSGGQYPHGEHREGRNVDTRVNNIPDQWEDILIQIFRSNNFGINDERFGSAPHLHLDWGNPSRNTGRHSSILQNGIDQNAADYDSAAQTPSMLVNWIGEAIFERQVTQPEFETWFQQLSNAKAQGPNIFLQEMKNFEKQLFASQEYIGRQRTDEQFVQDVFASHLFRDPTDEELSYWLGYLSNIGGNQEVVSDPNDPNPGRTRTTTPLSQTQKRQMFLNYFETLPDFVNVINRVENDAYQEPPH